MFSLCSVNVQCEDFRAHTDFLLLRWVDPNDRDHFLFSKAGEYKAWVSKDGGKTAVEYTDHNTGVYVKES